MSGPVVLLTGVTGMVGAELAAALVRVRGDAELVCLVRPGADGAEVRLAAALERVLPGGSNGRITAVAGDLEAENLGLSAEDSARLQGSVTEVIHSAACVRFDLPLSEARRINTGGTAAMLAFAQGCPGLRSFDYVSTAYVCGARTGLVLPEDPPQTPFHNSYEQSKVEAEALLRAAHRDQGLPLRIFRPSIVVGHSQTGFTPNNNTLYWPIKVYARGRWRLVPGRARSRFDIVPVDYVVDALLALRERVPCDGRAWHLCAGPDAAATAGEVTELARLAFDAKPILWIHPGFYKRALRPALKWALGARRADVFKGGAAYLPYFTSDLVFETRATDAALAEAGIKAPRVQSYFERLFDYCKATDFGKRPLLSATPTS